jgi:hypothetical protein
MTHCKVPLQKPTVHAKHPFVNADNHAKLLAYIKERLILGKLNRDNKIPRLVQIDKNVAGWMKMSQEDKERLRDKAKDGSPQATLMNLPLSFVHIDDMMTYFAQTFSPNRGMFYHTGKPDEVQEAGQIVTLMNNHAIYAGYFREVLLGIYAMLKYNEGGFGVAWNREQGPKLIRDATTQTDTLDMQLRWQGNRLAAIDNYNHLCDPSVHPTKLHCDGEFTAQAKLRSFYWLQNKANQGVYFNCEEALNGFNGLNQTVYYRSPPKEAMFTQATANASDPGYWVNVLSGVEGYAAASGFELVEIHIRLNPTEFGLIQGNKAAQDAHNRYEIWRFTVLNDTWIIDATYMNNIHGYLPAFMGLINDDLMESAQKSVAEILQPLQDFASFLLNVHVAATRSSIWGLTAYDPSVINLKSIPKGEVNATIPMNPTGYGKDINKSIWKDRGTLETKQTLQDLDAVMKIIDQFFPTQSLPSQIANIDRAVTSQVAAVQQGANRRQQKAARLLDDTVFRNVRFAMYYNILQYQPDSSEVTDFYTGKPVKIDLASLRNTDLPFIIGQGLKAIDRQAAAQMLQQVIFALIQAPQAAQDIDLLGLIDYWTSMIDIDVDMKQFEKQLAPTNPDGTPAEPGAEAAPTGNAIQPATNPQNVTAPIYGGNRPAA